VRLSKSQFLRLHPVISDNTTLPAEQIRLLNNITERIVVYADSVEITVKLNHVIADARAMSHLASATWECCDWKSLEYMIRLPVEIKRRGLNMRLMVQAPEYEVKRHADIRLVKLLSKAHYYFGLISSGKASSFKEIGISEKLSSSYVTRITLLAFLSPDIVKDILDGRHPPSLTSDKLMRSLPLPTVWAEQRKVLGFR
jgi:site-specific DNA recombinase